MRNLRRTRKKGGFQYVASIYECGTKIVRGKSVKVGTIECINDFTRLNNFTLVEVADDGNCFYDTLSKYGQRANNPILNKTNMELRTQIINTMIANRHDYEPFFAADIVPVVKKTKPKKEEATKTEEEVKKTIKAKKVETAKKTIKAKKVEEEKPLNIEGELQKFLKSGQWAGWLGDIVPQVAANILNINIVIYDLIVRDESNHIDMITFSSEVPSETTVNMLRTNGSHFRLLWPREEPRGVPNEEAMAEPRGAPAPSKPRRSVTVRKPKVASPTRSNSVSRNRTSSLENALMKIALLESEEASKASEKALKEAREAENALKTATKAPKKTLKQTKSNKKEEKKQEKKKNNFNSNNNFYNKLKELGF